MQRQADTNVHSQWITQRKRNRQGPVPSRHRGFGSRSGFTLVEVLIALGLAAIFLGVALNAIARDTLAVAQVSSRYQNTVWAGQGLEIKMEQGATTSSNQTGPTDPGNSSIGTQFVVNITMSDVIADPRVQAVESRVGQDEGSSRAVTGFRLKIRRQQGASSSSSTNSSATSNTTSTSSSSSASSSSGSSTSSSSSSSASTGSSSSLSH